MESPKHETAFSSGHMTVRHARLRAPAALAGVRILGIYADPISCSASLLPSCLYCWDSQFARVDSV